MPKQPWRSRLVWQKNWIWKKATKIYRTIANDCCDRRQVGKKFMTPIRIFKICLPNFLYVLARSKEIFYPPMFDSRTETACRWYRSALWSRIVSKSLLVPRKKIVHFLLVTSLLALFASDTSYISSWALRAGQDNQFALCKYRFAFFDAPLSRSPLKAKKQ